MPKRRHFFSYFAEVDRDDSGLLERNEVEYVAKMIFGEGKDEEIKKYVDGVFAKFDDNHSGALSFSESREFIKGLISWFDKEGILSDQETAELLKTVVSDEEPTEDAPEAETASQDTSAEVAAVATEVSAETTAVASEAVTEATATEETTTVASETNTETNTETTTIKTETTETTETTIIQETVTEVTAESSTSVSETTKVSSETVTESTTENMDSDGEISIPQPTLVQNAADQTSEEESIEIIEDIPKSSPEPEIINSDDGNEPADAESSALDTGSAEISRPNRGESAEENTASNDTDETPAADITDAINAGESDSDELVIPDGPETQVQSCVVDSDSDLSESFSEPILNSNFENNRESSFQIFEFSYVQKIGPFLIVNLAFFWSYLTGQIEDQL